MHVHVYMYTCVMFDDPFLLKLTHPLCLLIEDNNSKLMLFVDEVLVPDKQLKGILPNF